jgi:hypothetical protein
MLEKQVVREFEKRMMERPQDRAQWLALLLAMLNFRVPLTDS